MEITNLTVSLLVADYISMVRVYTLIIKENIILYGFYINNILFSR